MIARIPPQFRGAAATVAAFLASGQVPEGAGWLVWAAWACGAAWDFAILRAPDKDASGVPDWIEQRAPGLGALLVKAAASGLLHDVKTYIRLRLSHASGAVESLPDAPTGPREPLRRLNMDAGSHTAVQPVPHVD